MDKSFKDYLEINYNLNIPLPSQIPGKEETLIVFKESMFVSPHSDNILLNYKPVFTQNGNELAYNTILQIFESNKHLNFPRLSSLQHLHDLCPLWSQNYLFETGYNFMFQ